MRPYRLILGPDLALEFRALMHAAKSQPGGLRDRELRALRIGLAAIANGTEESLGGKRLGYSAEHHDLRDCAEIKIAVVQESRGPRDLGPSHRLIYREFEAPDGGPPIREAICFAHRKNNRPFELAAARLGREKGVRFRSLHGVSNHQRPHNGPTHAGEASPVRQPLPPELAQAMKGLEGNPSPRGATRPPGSAQPTAPPGAARRPPDRDRPYSLTAGASNRPSCRTLLRPQFPQSLVRQRPRTRSVPVQRLVGHPKRRKSPRHRLRIPLSQQGLSAVIRNHMLAEPHPQLALLNSDHDTSSSTS
jgi:hypothetical protein